jgi:cytochrome c556
MLSAQSKTDEDFDKLMKSVGAANGAMRKAADSDAAAVEAAKLVVLFKDAQQFWTARKNTEAAEWSAAAATHAAAIETAAKAKKTEDAAEHMKQLGGSCQSCHMKYREKTETGFAIKKS